MPKRKDENETAFATLQELIRRDAIRDGLEPEPVEEPTKDPKRQAAGRLGGKQSGIARATKISPRKRKQIAKKAARTRWQKER